MTLPCTLVFLLLDGGCWSAEAEPRLRDALKAAKESGRPWHGAVKRGTIFLARQR
jgi:hypothetical protein